MSSSEDESYSSRRSRMRGGDDDAPSRRRRKAMDSDEESEEEAPAQTNSRKQENHGADDKRKTVANGLIESILGKCFGAIDEERRKKIQAALIEGMFQLAEKKYGKKRPEKGGDARKNAMEDYDLYLRSLKAKVKTSEDKLALLAKQKKDMDMKVEAGEKEFAEIKSKLDKAEAEKQEAIKQERDPVLPKDFIVPQRLNKSNASLGAAMMKASSQMWEDKFSAMRAKKSGASDTPEWAQKKDKTAAMLKVGRTKKAADKTEKPTFAAGLKKTDKPAGRRGRHEDDHVNPFTVNLKKTGRNLGEEAAPKKKDEEEKREEEEEKPVEVPVAKKETVLSKSNDSEDEDKPKSRRQPRRAYNDEDSD